MVKGQNNIKREMSESIASALATTRYISSLLTHKDSCFFLFICLLRIFLMWTIFKVFIEFAIIFLQFFLYVLFFLAAKHVRSQLPDQRSNLHPLHWKAES